MSILDNIRTGVMNFMFGELLSEEISARMSSMQRRRDYREGRHDQTIIPKPGKTDDNIYLNFSGLAIDRSISMLFGNGVEFDLPGAGNDTPEDKYIEEVWDANKKEIFLHRLALLASEDGTGYIKTIKNGVVGKSGTEHVRLLVVDPKWVTMDTNPEDFEQVIRYTIRFNTTGADEKPVARKQIHELTDANMWSIEDWQASHLTAGKWELMMRELWEYEFPQVLHFQNLPAADDVYGMPDLTNDLIMLQDKLNFTASNINKIIRLHAHPKMYAYGMGGANKEILNMDIGEMMMANSADAYLKTLEMQSDLSSSSEFFKILRQAFFDVARTVDIDSLGDKLGTLTNFGLRVLYQDAINKIKTKQRLYGDALLELNRRLLVIAEMNTDPGEIIWPDPLPINGTDLSNELKTDLEIGILDKQTATGLKGYDYEQVQARLTDEETQTGDITQALLQGFNRGEI